MTSIIEACAWVDIYTYIEHVEKKGERYAKSKWGLYPH